MNIVASLQNAQLKNHIILRSCFILSFSFKCLQCSMTGTNESYSTCQRVLTFDKSGETAFMQIAVVGKGNSV